MIEVNSSFQLLQVFAYDAFAYTEHNITSNLGKYHTFQHLVSENEIVDILQIICVFVYDITRRTYTSFDEIVPIPEFLNSGAYKLIYSSLKAIINTIVLHPLYDINYAAIFLLLFMCFISFLVFREYNRNQSSVTTYFAFKDTPLNKKIVGNIQSKVGEYKAPWWYNSHVGTIISLGQCPNLQYERQIFSDQHRSFASDWYPGLPSRTSSKPRKFCVFLPGLGLSSKSKFCQKFIEVMGNAGYSCVVVNAQGIELPLRKARFWHPGHYHDSKLVLDYIRSHYPESSVYLVGFSAGSNIVHKLVLNYDTTKGFIKAAMTVCINSDYLASVSRLESTLQGKVYSALITLGYKHILNMNEHVHSAVDRNVMSKLLSCKFTSEYDSLAWRHLYGFETEKEYYTALSSSFIDKRLDIPFLAVQPRDDPLHSGDSREDIHVDEFFVNPHAIYMEPRYGNHFGFYEGPLRQAFSNVSSYTYPAKIACEFFETVTSD